MTGKKKRTSEDRTNENSVNVALDELMGLEDERQREEEEERRRMEEAEEEARAAEQERIEREVEQERLEEARRRIEAEAKRKEEEEQLRREEREREIRIRAQAEAAAMAAQQARLLEQELEMKRIAANHRKAPAWFWPVAAAFCLGLVGVGGVIYFNISSDAQNKVREARRDLEASRERAEERLSAVRSEYEAIQAERDAVRERVAILEKTNDELQEQNRKLQISTVPVRGGKGPRPTRPAAVVKPTGDGLGSIAGCNNPLGCDGELDDLPLPVGKKKSYR